MNRIARPGDFWSGLALAGLGGYVVVEAKGWVYMGPDGPGAGFFPLGYGIAMLVLSLWLVVHSVGAGRTRDAAFVWRDWARALACWAALLTSVAVLKIAGFFVAFVLLTWFIVAVMFRRPQRIAWAIAVVGAIAFEVVFELALGVGLPTGIWH